MWRVTGLGSTCDSRVVGFLISFTPLSEGASAHISCCRPIPFYLRTNSARPGSITMGRLRVRQSKLGAVATTKIQFALVLRMLKQDLRVS